MPPSTQTSELFASLERALAAVTEKGAIRAAAQVAFDSAVKDHTASQETAQKIYDKLQEALSGFVQTTSPQNFRP